jgi:hypothetical protein
MSEPIVQHGPSAGPEGEGASADNEEPNYGARAQKRIFTCPRDARFTAGVMVADLGAALTHTPTVSEESEPPDPAVRATPPITFCSEDGRGGAVRWP